MFFTNIQDWYSPSILRNLDSYWFVAMMSVKKNKSDQGIFMLPHNSYTDWMIVDLNHPTWSAVDNNFWSSHLLCYGIKKQYNRLIFCPSWNWTLICKVLITYFTIQVIIKVRVMFLHIEVTSNNVPMSDNNCWSFYNNFDYINDLICIHNYMLFLYLYY